MQLVLIYEVSTHKSGKIFDRAIIVMVIAIEFCDRSIVQSFVSFPRGEVMTSHEVHISKRLAWIQDELETLKASGLYNTIRTISSAQGAWLEVDGRRV